MQRLATLVLLGAVILSSIILTGAKSSAATEYQITAFSTSPSSLSDFQVIYIDNDADWPTARLSDPYPDGTDTVIQFSEVRIGTVWFDAILKTPGTGNTNPPTDGTGGTNWWFGYANTRYEGEYVWLSADNWTYSQIARDPIVPLPSGALLLGTGLLGLGALGWRRKRR